MIIIIKIHQHQNQKQNIKNQINHKQQKRIHDNYHQNHQNQHQNKDTSIQLCARAHITHTQAYNNKRERAQTIALKRKQSIIINKKHKCKCMFCV